MIRLQIICEKKIEKALELLKQSDHSPNPAKNNLQIQSLPTAKTKLTIVDFNGNVKLQTLADTSSYNLNIASLNAGNYLLKIETNDEVVTKKFVKE